MNRRKFLAVTGGISMSGLAGCTGILDDSTESEKPDGVFVPSHRDEMKMIGMREKDGVRVSLMYTVPHEFWLVTGTRKNKVTVEDADTMHLMAIVQDAETGIPQPDAEPTIIIRRDGEEVTRLNPWSMISQPMGYHFGDNVQFSESGSYEFEVQVTETNATTTSEFEDSFSGQTVTITNESFTPTPSELSATPVDDAGEPGAIPPMNMEMMDIYQSPEFSAYPVSVSEVKSTDDMQVAVGTLDGGQFGFDGDALSVFVQSPYNRYHLPLVSMTVSVLDSEGQEFFTGRPSPMTQAEVGNFYGIEAGSEVLEAGETVQVTFETPPQTSRHSGYETAFLQVNDLEFSL